MIYQGRTNFIPFGALQCNVDILICGGIYSALGSGLANSLQLFLKYVFIDLNSKTA